MERKLTTKSTSPAQQKYCVDADCQESVIEFGFMDGVLRFGSLHDHQFESHLQCQLQESEEDVKAGAFAEIVRKDLLICMIQIQMRDREFRLCSRHVF